MKKFVRSTLAAAFVMAGVCGTASAANLEPAGIDLGGTSFFDGFSATKPGWAYLGYYQYGYANHIVDNNGNDVAAFKNPVISNLLLLNQLAYTSSYTLFNGNGHVGFTVLLPFLMFNSHVDPGSPAPALTFNNGLGDTTWGVNVQMNPVISGGRPVFSQRFEVDVIAPTGQYNDKKDINPGSNFWSISPYWSATVLPTPKTEISWRLNYIYNFANSSPLPQVPGSPAITKDQAGQAMWLNYTASYAVKPNLNVGINGYWFQQLNYDKYWLASGGTTTDGAPFADGGKSSVFAIGPGLFWKIDHHNMLAVNLYVQTNARNRARGTVLNVHWTHPF